MQISISAPEAKLTYWLKPTFYKSYASPELCFFTGNFHKPDLKGLFKRFITYITKFVDVIAAQQTINSFSTLSTLGQILDAPF